MDAKEKEFLTEKQKLKNTKWYIDREVKESEDRLEKGFDDYTFDDYADDFMKAALRHKFEQRIKTLKMITDKPYFSRVDFIEDGFEKNNAFYLGKTSVTDDETLEQIIIDWRAPVANLYYEGRLGEAHYNCPAGDINGNITLKRQYFYKEGELNNFLDIDVTTNDEMLQPYLSASADTRLKSIIATIQAEQNQIIRANMWKPLIVQGVAGSGKTTIALHRIAYLIYNYDKTFFPEEFLIIAPNKFFLNYISNVLPDLGVDRVQQSTYEEIAFEVIGEEFNIEEPNDKLGFIIDNNKSEKEKRECEIIEKASEFKSSIRFKRVLDEYVYEIEKDLLPNEDFMIDKYIIMDRNEINDLFTREYSNLPLYRRIEEIQKHLVNSISSKGEAIVQEIEEDRRYKVALAKFEISDESERKKEVIKIYEENEWIINGIQKNSKKLAQAYFKNIRFKDPYGYYKDFIDNYLEVLASGRLGLDEIKYIKNNFSRLQKHHKIEMEDIAPLMFIKYMIHGIKTKFDLKHIVIDEAQDFSEFQFYIFKKIVKSNSLTILGDLAQGIYYYRGTKNWKKTMDMVFGEDTELEYLTLKKTYRTTAQIMDTANKVISHLIEKLNCSLGEPVIKSGEPVLIQKFEDEKEMANKILFRLEEFKNKGFKNIALICKTIEDGQILRKNLNLEDVHIISSKDSEYKGGISIVPSYLSKGLEFDAVIITNADKFNYTMSEVDTKLLYVCITRAMNTLDIYHVNSLTELLI
jgi:DNA helicase-2/ATP-dependent DNA helicase PcrA